MAFTIDIKGLRHINVENGWERGDQILKRTVEILQSSLKDAVIVRYSGDNFLIFHSSQEAVKAAVRELEEKLNIKVTFHQIGEVEDVEALKIKLTGLEFES